VYLHQGVFGGLDELVAYCIVRDFQPRSIVEIGSGCSSLILGEGLTKNDEPNLVCIDPSPQDFLRHNFPGLDSLIEKGCRTSILTSFRSSILTTSCLSTALMP